MSVFFPVPADVRWREHTASAGQTVFPVNYPFQDNADITIVRIGLDGTETTLAQPGDYALTGAGNPVGGSYTLTAPATEGEIYRSVGTAVMDRVLSVVRNGKFKSDAIDDDLDRALIRDQEMHRDVDRAWKAPFGEAGRLIEDIPEGHFWKRDANGNMVDGGDASELHQDAIEAKEARDFAARWASDPEDGPPIDDGVNPPGQSSYHWAQKGSASAAGALSARQVAVQAADDAVQALSDMNDLADTFGTAALQDVEYFATAAQGLKADAAASVQYVDEVFAATNKRIAPVHTSAAGNLDVSSPGDTYDGYTLSNGQSLLLNAQSNPAENGIYTFNGAGVPLTRRSDQDTWDEIWGAIVYIRFGGVRGGWTMFNRQQAGGTLGTDALSYSLISENNVSPSLLPNISANTMLVDNAAGTARETKDFTDARNLLEVAPLAYSKAQLKAFDTSRTTIAFLVDGTGFGLFRWVAGNRASRVTADTAEGIFIASGANPSGNAGAWERDISGIDIMPEWFGAVPQSDGNGPDCSPAFNVLAAALSFTSHKTILLSGRYRLAQKLVLTGRGINLRGVSTGGISSDGAALLFYTGSDGQWNDTNCLEFVDAGGLNVEHVQLQVMNPGNRQRWLVYLDGISNTSFYRVRGLTLRSSGFSTDPNRFKGVWYRRGQTLRMSECHWTDFGGAFVFLQGCGDPSSTGVAQARAIATVTSADGGTRTRITTSNAIQGITTPGAVLVFHDVVQPSDINTTWQSADWEYVSNTEVIVNVPYVAGWSTGGFVSTNPDFIDTSRRPDIVEIMRCRFAGQGTPQGDLDTILVSSGGRGGSMSLTDCTYLYGAHAFVLQRDITANTNGTYNPSPELAASISAGFIWISGKGGEAMRHHAFWLKSPANHVRIDNIYVGTFDASNKPDTCGIVAEAEFKGPLVINGVYIRAAQLHGIHVKCNDVSITGGAVGRSGQNGLGTGDNIKVDSTAADVVITGVNCSDPISASEPNASTRYGINCESTTRVSIVGNNVQGTTKGMSFAKGPNVEVANNVGHRTANKGRASISLSGTTATIAHGLAEEPTYFEAQLENSAENDRFVRLVSKDATNITISIWDVSAGALLSSGAHAVMWRAEV